MEYILENEVLKLKVVSAGAEMKSLTRKADGQEYLWKADPAFWGRTAPVLFPLVGKVVDDRYTENGVEYQMSQHGFARDKEFTCVSQTEEEIQFSLCQDEETKKVYPYDFELVVAYKLSGNDVEVTWTVKNPTTDTIYYSLGGHPAFACPLKDGESQTAYSFALETDKDAVVCTKFVDGYVTGETKEVALQNKVLPIDAHLFDEDALVIENNQVHKVSLLDANKEAYLTVSYDAPVVGLWSPPKKNAPFVCIEPWYGRCDRADFKGEWKEREWGNALNANEEKSGGYVITIK